MCAQYNTMQHIKNEKLKVLIAKLEQHNLGENFSVNIDKATKGVGFSVKIACPHECNQITLIHTPVSLDELSKRKEYNFGTIPYDMDFGYQVKAEIKIQ